MQVERLYMHNRLRNFNYIVACSETGEAIVIDPLDAKKCYETAVKNGWNITTIINTHEHHDHIEGNADLIKQTGARVLAHEKAMEKIGGVDQGLKGGDVVTIGNTVKFNVLDTPGHTFSHVCLLSQGEKPALFCGDTLFNAGVGHCRSGDPNLLFDSVLGQIARLPEETLIYPGHDYRENNLRFTLSREPNNEVAMVSYKRLDQKADFCDQVTSLGDEKQFNVFFRLSSPEVIQQVQKQFSDLNETPIEKEIFLKLRQLRDKW